MKKKKLCFVNKKFYKMLQLSLKIVALRIFVSAALKYSVIFLLFTVIIFALTKLILSGHLNGAKKYRKLPKNCKFQENNVYNAIK